MFKQKVLIPVIEYMQNFMVLGLNQLPTKENYKEFNKNSSILISLDIFKENGIKFLHSPTGMHFCHEYGQRAIIEAESHLVDRLTDVKKFAYVYSIHFNTEPGDKPIIIRGVTKERIEELNEEMKKIYDDLPLTEFPIMM